MCSNISTVPTAGTHTRPIVIVPTVVNCHMSVTLPVPPEGTCPHNNKEKIFSHICFLQKKQRSGADFLAQFGETNLNVFLDYGTEVYLIKRDYVYQLHKQSFMYINSSSSYVKGISGTPLDILGQISF